jgi:hypothetical protein
MKRLVSLLAVALVSSLFAAGCGKLTECKEAKEEKDCVQDRFLAPFTCKWEKAQDDAKKGTCVDIWEAKGEAKDACEEAKEQGECDKAAKEATKADATATCKWAKVGDAKEATCHVVKLLTK